MKSSIIKMSKKKSTIFFFSNLMPVHKFLVDYIVIYSGTVVQSHTHHTSEREEKKKQFPLKKKELKL